MKRFLTLVALVCAAFSAQAKGYTVTSPDGHLSVTVQDGKTLSYSLTRDDVLLITPSPISLTLQDGTVWGPGSRFSKAARRHVDEVIPAPVYKRAQVKDCYNELTLHSKLFSLVFRVYDDGMAWKFLPKGDVTVAAEEATFSFAADWSAYIPYVSQHTETLESQYISSFEAQYAHNKLSEWNKARLGFLPITIEADGLLLSVLDTDVCDYPGMFLYNGDGSTTLKGVFAPVPDTYIPDDDHTFQLLPATRKNVIAENTDFLPWRCVLVATEDKQLAQSDFSWRLAAPQAPGDWSWVKPGKVAWDWWNAWNLYDVDFEAGINTQTYKYYVDFAASKGIEYVVLDEGWARNTIFDMFHTIDAIDLPELVNYAAGKGVGIILWTLGKTLDRDLEALCALYSKMGVKGWKIDFMDRDDQLMMQFYERAASVAAKYHMLTDFHGAPKPVGLQRKYPSIVNYEGVFGLENMKWAPESIDQVTYDVTIPYTRLVAGSADYTQGAMRNAAKGNYRPVSSEGMSQGTRCHQLAEYLVFDAPLSMLCDSPSNYLREPECTDWIAGVPTVWDETVALDGKIGEYVVLARRKGSTWYVGALNGWTPRDLTLDLSFIGPGSAVVFADGVNAHRAGRDYRKETLTLDGGSVTIHLAPGGGWVLQTL